MIFVPTFLERERCSKGKQQDIIVPCFGDNGSDRGRGRD
jgi:hypothetical protein